jgi:hypothetical protein
VEAAAPDGRRIARTIDARSGESIRVALAFESPRSSPPEDRSPPVAAGDPAFPAWPGFVALGAGAAGLTVMGIFGAVAVSRNATSDDLAASCAASGAGCEEGRAEREAASDAATISTGGLVVGAAGLAAAGALFVVHASSAAEGPGAAAIRVVPSVSSGGAGAWVRGAF